MGLRAQTHGWAGVGGFAPSRSSQACVPVCPGRCGSCLACRYKASGARRHHQLPQLPFSVVGATALAPLPCHVVCGVAGHEGRMQGSQKACLRAAASPFEPLLGAHRHHPLAQASILQHAVSCAAALAPLPCPAVRVVASQNLEHFAKCDQTGAQWG